MCSEIMLAPRTQYKYDNCYCVGHDDCDYGFYLPGAIVVAGWLQCLQPRRSPGLWSCWQELRTSVSYSHWPSFCRCVQSQVRNALLQQTGSHWTHGGEQTITTLYTNWSVLLILSLPYSLFVSTFSFTG